MDDRSNFETAWRKAIEWQPLSAAETILREAIRRLNDPALEMWIARLPEEVYIDRWSVIDSAMKNARAGLSSGKMGAMILGLIHRNSATLDMTIDLSFARTSAPAPLDLKRHSFETESSHRDRLNRSHGPGRLPEVPHVKPAWINPLPRLVGMEGVRSIYDRVHSADAVMAKMLCAAAVFLRFCQAAERHLRVDSDAPRLPTYLTVKAEPWPMETATVDYCNHAVRLAQ